MSFDVSVAGLVISNEGAAYKSFHDDLNMVFHLDSTFSTLVNANVTLVGVPATASASKVAYAGPASSWNPSGGPVTFGLSAGFSGAIEVLNSGTLISYTDGLDSPQPQAILVPQGRSYVRVTLSFNISANVAGAYSNGPFGVKASADTTDTYEVVYCKAFPPTALLRDAISQSLKGFVLPLHAATLSQMSDGDYLEYEFDGSVNLAFGAYVGLDKTLYAGQGSADLRLPGLGSNALTLAASVAPEIKAGIRLGYTLQYQHTFEALLSRTGDAGELHLFRSTRKNGGLTFNAGFTLSANATATVGVSTTAIQSAICGVASGANATEQKVLGSLATAGANEITKYVDELNAKLGSWTAKADGHRANLQVAIENNQTSTLLVGYTFSNLDSAGFTAAWTAAIGGDFVAAFNTGVVTLDVGSGLEKSFQTKTSFNLNFFNLWHWGSWSDFASNTSLVYAGNNIFHLLSRIGRDSETDSVGAMRKVNFYFAVAATVSGSGTVSDVDLSLHLDLTSQGDKGATSNMATLLHAIEAGPACDALAEGLHAFAKSKGTAELHITIPKAGFSRINCDLYTNGKPATTSTYNDQLNYTTFAKAADDVDGWTIPNLVSGPWVAYMESFDAWKALNLTMNDSVNRLMTAYNIGKWPDTFPAGMNSGTQQLVIYSMSAGQEFMNFCADLKALMQATDVGMVGETWGDLLARVTKAIKQDSNVDFVSVTTLALLRLCQTGGITVEGPAAGADGVFAVTLSL